MNADASCGAGPGADLTAVAVARKLGGIAPEPALGVYALAFRAWLGAVTSARFAGLVLDYDGTVWVPRWLWPQVVVGMHNGGIRRALTDVLPQTGEIPRPDVSRATAAALADVVARLSTLPTLIRLDVRIGQVTVHPHDGKTPHDRLVELTRSVVARPPTPAVCVLESAHAVDIVPADVTKAAVVAQVATLAAGPVLTIGDQGQLGGNDFALLACQSHSLSVDRCSADPTRCWNLADPVSADPTHCSAISPRCARIRSASSASARRTRWLIRARRHQPSAAVSHGTAAVKAVAAMIAARLSAVPRLLWSTNASDPADDTSAGPAVTGSRGPRSRVRARPVSTCRWPARGQAGVGHAGDQRPAAGRARRTMPAKRGGALNIPPDGWLRWTICSTASPGRRSTRANRRLSLRPRHRSYSGCHSPSLWKARNGSGRGDSSSRTRRSRR